jgi:2-polyprenyl-6-methoxyphenol hydroxylase-like FAD-dependent oxidoreductase
MCKPRITVQGLSWGFGMKIAIVGCGIGGLAAAGFLSDTEHEITLYDQFDTPAPVGSGLVIQPVGLRILEKLGAAEHTLAKGAKGYRMLGYEAVTKRKVLDVSYGPVNGSDFGLGIHRASLFDALLQTCLAKGVQITNAHKVTDCTLVGKTRVMTFADGRTSDPFDLVIDASGAGSPLSPLQSKTLHYGALWGTVDWPENTGLRYDQLQQRYRRASNMIGILPIGKLPGSDTPKAALFWSLPHGQFQKWQDTSLDHWKSKAKALWPALAPFVEQIKTHDDMTMASYTHGTLRTPYSCGLVHIGDAAHRASPQLGQGANMALLDAYALVECLKLHPLKQALPAYHKARKRHVAIYQAMSWAFTPMYQSDSRILPLIRDILLAPTSTIWPVSSILTALVKGTMVSPYRGLP